MKSIEVSALHNISTLIFTISQQKKKKKNIYIIIIITIILILKIVSVIVCCIEYNYSCLVHMCYILLSINYYTIYDIIVIELGILTCISMCVCVCVSVCVCVCVCVCVW